MGGDLNGARNPIHYILNGGSCVNRFSPPQKKTDEIWPCIIQKTSDLKSYHDQNQTYFSLLTGLGILNDVFKRVKQNEIRRF